MDENIIRLIEIASRLEAFKMKAYSLLLKSQLLDEFIMRNAPCNYDLQKLITEIHEGKKVHKVEPCENGIFHGIKCLESSDQVAFFKNESDVRPSSCIWIDKTKAESLYRLFRET